MVFVRAVYEECLKSGSPTLEKNQGSCWRCTVWMLWRVDKVSGLKFPDVRHFFHLIKEHFLPQQQSVSLPLLFLSPLSWLD